GRGTADTLRNYFAGRNLAFWPDEGADLAEIVLLADADAVVAQDVVGGDDVEIEVRQGPGTQELQTVHGDGDVHVRGLDVAGSVFGAVEGGDRHAAQLLDRRRDLRPEFGERLARLLRHGIGLAGQPRRAVLGIVAGEGHLRRQRVHVGRQPGIDQV